jgi:hypothetical protein
MATLSDFGARVEAEHHDERCQAFDDQGDRCPYARESGSRYCTDCSREEALLTLADLREHRPGEKISTFWHCSGVKDILRDSFDFPARDAVVLKSGSALSTAYVLEGRLTWCAHDAEDSFRVCGQSYSVDRGRELLAKMREHADSATFVEKWADACRVVGQGKIRCSNPRKTARACRWHHKRDEVDEFPCVDEYDVPYGPEVSG